MNTGLIATVLAVVSLLVTFLLGRKSGAFKENEKLRLNLEAYTEKMETQTRNAETKAETAEKKAELATRVVEAVREAAESGSGMEELTKQAASPDADTLALAQQQADRAREFMLR